MKTYQEVTEFLHSQLPMFQRLGKGAFKKDLTNIRHLCDLMDHPERSVPMVHIAGTNGKGSVSHILSALLQDAGLSVGLYTSPHYVDFRERVRINSNPISQDEVIDFVTAYEQIFREVQPSFFEWSFALALHFFHRKRPDIAIIETGLGGRLDSTNIIHPILSVITNVSLDHQSFLGDTIPEIALEKLGIVKKGIPLLLGEKSEEYQLSAANKTKSLEAPMFFAEDMISVRKSQRNDKDSFLTGQWVDIQFNTGELSSVLLDLDGDYQLENLRTALASYQLIASSLSLSADHWQHSSILSQIRKKSGMLGRWQVVQSDPPVILDGAHNLAAIHSVMKSFLEMDAERYFIIMGVSNDKNIDDLLNILPPFLEYHFTQADVPRALHHSQYLEQAKLNYGLRAEGHETIISAYQAVMKKATPFDAVLITGSIFLVGEWLSEFHQSS